MLHIAAIDMQILTDRETGDRACQKHHCRCYLLRLTQTPYHALIQRILVGLWRLLLDVLPGAAFENDRARRHAVDPNTFFSQDLTDLGAIGYQCRLAGSIGIDARRRQYVVGLRECGTAAAH